MKKAVLLVFLVTGLHLAGRSQLAVFKLVGKNSGNTKLGFGAFAYTQIPLNDIGNRNLMIEWMDLAIFPPKDPDINSIIAYLSIKLGYKYVFSQETGFGFFIVPSAGYCRVVRNTDPDGEYRDCVALAFETGYSLEVGQQANNLNFGLKYETNTAGTRFTANSIGLRFSYSFHLFRKKER